MEIRKISFFITLIFSTYVQFLDLLFLDKFITILLALLSLATLLLSVMTLFEIKSDNQIIFNIKVSSIAILLKR